MRLLTTCKKPISFLQRIGKSRLTGKNYGEIYAINVKEQSADILIKNLNDIVKVTDLPDSEGGNRGKLHDLYQKYSDEHAISINDWTEDFDEQKDLLGWLNNRRIFGNNVIVG